MNVLDIITFCLAAWQIYGWHLYLTVTQPHDDAVWRACLALPERPGLKGGPTGA
jgi:hypothetical protein